MNVAVKPKNIIGSDPNKSDKIFLMARLGNVSIKNHPVKEVLIFFDPASTDSFMTEELSSKLGLDNNYSQSEEYIVNSFGGKSEKFISKILNV